MGFFSSLGLVKPKTKADCDERIAILQADIERRKAMIATMPNGKPHSAEACNKNQAKYQLGIQKAKVAKLKTLRKTLK